MALNTAGFTWAGIRTHNRGRDVLLLGTAPNDIAVQQALDVLAVNPAIRVAEFAGAVSKSLPVTTPDAFISIDQDGVLATDNIERKSKQGSNSNDSSKPDFSKSRLRVEVKSDTLTLAGTLADSSANADYISQLIASAKSVFGQDNVLNQISVSTNIVDSLPQIDQDIFKTLKATPFVNAEFAQKPSGFTLEDNTVVLTGIVENHTQRQSYKERVSALFAGEVTSLVAAIDPKGRPDLRVFPLQDDKTCAAKISSLLASSKITFEEGNTLIKPESYGLLEHLSTLIKRCPDAKFDLIGHTDNTGDSDSNLLLSVNRAESVKDFLLYLGVAAHHLMVKGVGATQPLASESSEAGRAMNRRVEFHLIDRASNATNP